MKKKLLVGICFLSLASTFAARRGTDGGNGSDQQGKSIPLKLDRGVKVSALQDAVKSCGFKQFQELVRPIHEGELDKELCRNSSSRYINCYVEVKGHDQIRRVRLNHNSVSFRIHNSSFSKDTKKTSIIPHFEYTETFPNRSINYMGDVIPGEIVAKEVKIKMGSEEVRFLNQESGHPIGFVFDAVTYSNCLEREIYENMD